MDSPPLRGSEWHAVRMTEHPENTPAYRTIRVAAPEGPVAALADAEAWAARESYPDLRFAGGPVFGVARERDEGGWQLQGFFCGPAPQDARDHMGAHFRGMAQRAERTGDATARSECERAAERLDWEALDELTVQGSRYRVVRAERFIRTGPVGPEPPRPTDADPAKPGRSHEVPDPVEGFVLDPVTATGMSAGLLKVELLGIGYAKGAVPDDVRDDCLRAGETHPGGVLVPPSFMTSEKIDGRWKPQDSGTATSPQGARDSLGMYLRVVAPWKLELDAAARTEYEAAADRLDAERGAELAVAERRFRIVRVERLVRVGPDGPEGPRRSDPDPQPPVMVQTQRLRDQGRWPDPDDEAPDGEPDESTKRFTDLFQRERDRSARLDDRPGR
jgi:hypothetical protein